MTRLRVLLVENRLRVAERLKAQLEHLGHEVVALANDGPEAVRFAWRLKPDLIIMERHLPIIGGIETARTILTRTSPPIILLTAYDSAEFVRQAREAGVTAYLVTAGRPRPLGPVIKAALKRFQELSERALRNTARGS